MKKIILATTRWEYYVANVGGILAIVGLFIWFLTLAITNEGIDFTSAFFWMALLLLIVAPYALIGFFSSMKNVEVTATGLTISYVFQKHTNVIRFSDIAEMRSRRPEQETPIRPGFRDTFTLILRDRRIFEFDRSQFHQYAQLKAICRKHVKR